MDISHVPATLYKYMHPDRVDVLSTLQFRHTPLEAFNDPFEGRPEIKGFASPDYASEKFDELLPSEIERAYSTMDSEFKAKVSYPVFASYLDAQLRSSKDVLLALLDKVANATLPTVQAGFTQQLGALCLCEEPDSLLMWAHYGVSHTGFVLQFDARHPYFHSRRSDEDELRHLRRVLYRHTRPSASLIELDAPDLFLVKSSHWAYEREWRILRPITDADAVRTVNGEAIHLFACPPEAIQAVILGARASPTLAEQVRESLRANDALAHVKLKSCAADESHFVLKIRSDTR